MLNESEKEQYLKWRESVTTLQDRDERFRKFMGTLDVRDVFHVPEDVISNEDVKILCRGYENLITYLEPFKYRLMSVFNDTKQHYFLLCKIIDNRKEAGVWPV